MEDTHNKQGLPILSFPSPEVWADWLDAHHINSEGLWLKIPKKGVAVDGVSYDEALDVALCYGWIDSQKAALDDTHWLQRFTPRRQGSKWSKINRERAEALIERGLIKPAGLREIALAKADGRWDAAYAGQRTMAVPDDLKLALARNPEASQFFDTLDSANRYAILYRIMDAKRPETRANRIEKYVAMLSRHEKIHP